MTITPPHAVRDEGKLAAMVAAIRDGQQLPPVIVVGADGGGNVYALSGSHRLAAWQQTDVEPRYIDIEDGEYVAAAVHLGDDPDDVRAEDKIGDYDEFVAALRATGAELGDAE